MINSSSPPPQQLSTVVYVWHIKANQPNNSFSIIFMFSIVLLNCVLCIENIFGHFFQFFLVKMLQTFFNYWEWVLTLTPNIPRMHFSALRKIVGSHVLQSLPPSHSLKKVLKIFLLFFPTHIIQNFFFLHFSSNNCVKENKEK